MAKGETLYSLSYEARIERWDDDTQDWVPVDDVSESVAWSAMAVQERLCRCRGLPRLFWPLARLWPERFGCNGVWGSRYEDDGSFVLSGSVFFNDDPKHTPKALRS